MTRGQKFRKLGRTPAHRADLRRTMLGQLLVHEQIVTTAPKAKEIAKVAEKIIDLARRGTDVARERAYWKVYQQERVLPKLFGELHFRYKDRSKNFTRITLNGYRQGDQGAKALIELVDSPIDTSSLFAIEHLPKLKKDLELTRLKLVAALKRKQDDWYQRHLLRKEIVHLEDKERDLEKLIVKLEYALKAKETADQSRVDWAKWEIERDIRAKTAVMKDLKSKVEAFRRLGGKMSTSDLMTLIEQRKYDGAKTAKITWNDWEEFSKDAPVPPSQQWKELLDKMVAQQEKGLLLIEAARTGVPLPKPQLAEPISEQKSEAVEAPKEVKEPMKRSGLLARLRSFVGR